MSNVGGGAKSVEPGYLIMSKDSEWLAVLGFFLKEFFQEKKKKTDAASLIVRF